MKKILVTLAFFGLIVPNSQAQRCLDLNILAQMANMITPGYSAQCFNECTTKQNDHNQTEIVDYGANYNRLDAQVKRVLQDFNNAAMANMSGGGYQQQGQMSAQQAQAGQALATKLQNMSPDERKTYMIQYMQQNHAVATSPQMTDNAQTEMLVMQAYQWATRDLYQLNLELAGKYRDVASAELAEINGVKSPPHSQCPGVDKVGWPSCGCVNGLESGYWGKIVAIRDKYITQKVTLLQSYEAQMKVIVGKIEDIIVKLQYGDALKSSAMKLQLRTAQQSAFGGAFDATVGIVEGIHKDAANTYVNKHNADAGVYALDCAHQ
jgi:hypothetical protein